MKASEYGSLSFSVRRADIKGYTVESLDIESSNWPDATYTATLEAREINRLFENVDTYLLEPRIRLEGNTLGVTGSMKMGNSVIEIADATGHIQIRSGVKVFFIPERIKIAGVSMFYVLVNAVKSFMARNPVYTVSEDLPLRLCGVSVENGLLKISGDMNLEKTIDLIL